MNFFLIEFQLCARDAKRGGEGRTFDASADLPSLRSLWHFLSHTHTLSRFARRSGRRVVVLRGIIFWEGTVCLSEVTRGGRAEGKKKKTVVHLMLSAFLSLLLRG